MKRSYICSTFRVDYLASGHRFVPGIVSHEFQSLFSVEPLLWNLLSADRLLL